MLEKLSATLESSCSSWPRLRHLVLRGSAWSELPEPFVAICARMLNLRLLGLKVNPTHHGAMPQALWPQGFPSSFPWPELERLTISYPDPTDIIYDHLPPSLRSLSLRCWTHIFIQRHFVGRRAGEMYTDRFDSILDASAILSIIRRSAES